MLNINIDGTVVFIQIKFVHRPSYYMPMEKDSLHFNAVQPHFQQKKSVWRQHPGALTYPYRQYGSCSPALEQNTNFMLFYSVRKTLGSIALVANKGPSEYQKANIQCLLNAKGLSTISVF